MHRAGVSFDERGGALDRGRSVLNEKLATTSVNHVCRPWGVFGRVTEGALKPLEYRLKRRSNRYIHALPGRGRRLFPAA